MSSFTFKKASGRYSYSRSFIPHVKKKSPRQKFKREQSRSRRSTWRSSRTSTPKENYAKKSKSPSRSKTARKLIDLTRRAKIYKADVDRYVELLQHASLWFEKNLEEVWNIICGINLDEAETITYDSFKAVTVFYYLGKTLNLYSRKNHICAPSVKLFRKQVSLPPQEIEQVGASLEQLGIKGGTRLSPMEVTILYQTQCSINLPRASLFVNSITDCYLLWDEATLWLEDVEPRSPGMPPEKSRSTGESVTLMGSVSGSESDSNSVDSLMTFFTVEERTKRRAKRMRSLVRRCEQRMRDLEGAHSPPPSTTSSSVS
ncbi:hypothetical protein TSMEX_004193 [Taenia solium]|eukprot:TsM_001148700 transcript=TsM_001148700 gene=TsM_001148700